MNIDVPDFSLKDETGPSHACDQDCRYFRTLNGDGWSEWALCTHPRSIFGLSPVSVGRDCKRFEASTERVRFTL